MRCGVRCRPSRSGSSPRRTSTSRSNSSMLAPVMVGVSVVGFIVTSPQSSKMQSQRDLIHKSEAQLGAARVFEGVQHGLLHADFLHRRCGEVLQDIVNLDAQIFCRWHGLAKLRQRVEVLMAKSL